VRDHAGETWFGELSDSWRKRQRGRPLRAFVARQARLPPKVIAHFHPLLSVNLPPLPELGAI